MNKAELDEIRQRCEAATPGEWVPGIGLFDDHKILSFETRDSGHNNGIHFIGKADRGHDAIFIAHARQDIPTLLDYIAELKAERVKLMKLLLERWTSCETCRMIEML